MKMIDSHAHLQTKAFTSDAASVIAEARGVGVARILVPGMDAETSRTAVRLAKTVDLEASAGIHPHLASAAEEDDWKVIVELASDEVVVAVGETGLDYDRAFSPRDVQLLNLRRHIELGRAIGKPVILHCRARPGKRDAHDDLLHELSQALGTSSMLDRPPALLHSFSGPVDYAQSALAMGLAISFSGLVFRAGEDASADVARLVPADRLLVETDSPYLSPPGAPRRRNEPRWVAVTIEWLAKVRGEDPATLGDQLVANYDRIFSRQPSSPDPSPTGP